MSINFPDSPSLDDVFTAEEKYWVWNGTTWSSFPTPLYLNELADITISTALTGEVVQYNGTAWVNADIIAQIVDAAPGTLDTLNELAAALGDDANFATTVSDSLAGKAPTVHSHVISDVTSLQGDLDGKAASVHSHVISDVTSLQSDLDAKAATVHDHVISDVTGLQTGLDGKAASVHSHVISDVTSLQGDLDAKATLTQAVSAKTTAYSLVVGDRGAVITCNGTFAVTIPSATFAAGDRVDFINTGTGVITFTGSGVTVNSVDAAVTIDTQWAGASFLFTSSSAGVLIGKLA